MKFCSCLLVSCLMSCALLQRMDRGTHTPAQRVDRSRPRPRPLKMGEELTAKLLRLDELSKAENDVMEPKRKRSFPGNNAPLDRLSMSAMETKQSKGGVLPRQRVGPPPIDRIGAGRLSGGRG